MSDVDAAANSDGFAALLRRTREATLRGVRDVIDSDAALRMSDADFDDALWLALCGQVGSVDDLKKLPDGVRMYFATRTVEWDVANGGFEHAVQCAAEYFREAAAGYRLLGDEASVELMLRALALADEPAALEALNAEVDRSPWNGVPWGDAARIRYVRDHRDEFLVWA